MPQASPTDDRTDGLPFPTSSLREYGTGNKFGKQVESMPLMAAGSPAMLPLIICFYREIRWEKTTRHLPATSAQRSAGFLIRHLSWSINSYLLLYFENLSESVIFGKSSQKCMSSAVLLFLLQILMDVDA